MHAHENFTRVGLEQFLEQILDQMQKKFGLPAVSPEEKKQAIKDVADSLMNNYRQIPQMTNNRFKDFLGCALVMQLVMNKSGNNKEFAFLKNDWIRFLTHTPKSPAERKEFNRQLDLVMTKLKIGLRNILSPEDFKKLEKDMRDEKQWRHEQEQKDEQLPQAGNTAMFRLIGMGFVDALLAYYDDPVVQMNVSLYGMDPQTGFFGKSIEAIGSNPLGISDPSPAGQFKDALSVLDHQAAPGSTASVNEKHAPGAPMPAATAAKEEEQAEHKLSNWPPKPRPPTFNDRH